MPKGSWGRIILPGLGDPKENPRGVSDGQPVNIPAPLWCVDYGETSQVGTSGVTDYLVQASRHWASGKSGAQPSRGVMRRTYGSEESLISGQEKPLRSIIESVPQSDTGRRGEQPQVGE